MKTWKPGDPYIWLTGGALAFALLMVAGLVTLVLVSGAGFFWPARQVEFKTTDGQTVLGPITMREAIPQPDKPDAPLHYRLQVKRANRDLYGSDFVWIDEADIRERADPADAMVVERSEWGDFHGYFQRLESDGRSISNDWNFVRERLALAHRVADEARAIEKRRIGAINKSQEALRIRIKSAGATDETRTELAALQERYRAEMAALNEVRGRMTDVLVARAPGGQEVRIPLTKIVRYYQPNSMSTAGKAKFYAAKVWEFVSDDPRESNTEGGVWPAIFGTVLMVILMSIVVTPLGVIAAFYLREYAKQGPVVSAVRIAVNNLAGVPSIVFGVFGVGFFIYLVGGSIDQLFFADKLPTPTFGTGGILWASLTLSLMTLPVVIVATEEGLAAIPPSTREGSLALGATKFETTWRVVLPAVTPAILTGLILAMARAAGEVAPLMITGVVKLAPALPLDGEWPFVHLDRKFMHLGFHIYDVGFQSPNVDAARPMVYTTTILLLSIVLTLNLAAIAIRARLRKKYAVTHL